MSSYSEILDRRIAARTQRNLRRELRPPCGIDFTSNDYLGFANDPELRATFDLAAKKLPLSGSGSRLLRGDIPIYDSVEKVCADFSKQESALLYPSGYQANIGLFSALLTSEDQVFSDELNHASIIDGMRLGKAKKFIYPHLDLNALEKLLFAAPPCVGMRVVVTESIFGMDGSFAKIPELIHITEKFGAALIVDEAHATGLYGSGRVADGGFAKDVLATIHTGGKSLGASGAWIAGSAKLRDYLIQYSRAFIYSTAPFPEQALLLKLAIEHWRKVGNTRTETLFSKVILLKKSLLASGNPGLRFHSETSEECPIVPIIIGETEKTIRIANELQLLGFDIRAIRPPTVAEGSSRLRIILHADQKEADIFSLARALVSVLEAERSQ